MPYYGPQTDQPGFGGQGIYDWQHNIVKQLYPWLFQTPVSESPAGKGYYPTPEGYGMPDFMSMQRRGGGDMPSWMDEMTKLITSPRLGQGMRAAGQGDVGSQLRDLMMGLVTNPREGMGSAWDLLQYLMPTPPTHQGMTDYEIEQLLQTLF